MQFFPERKVNEMMVKTSVEWYLDAVNKALICSRKVKKRVISQLSDDICGLEEEYEHELSREEIEAQFGSPEEAAKGFLKVTEIREKISAKRIIAICLIVVCAVIIGYVGYEFIQERKFADGYAVETPVYNIEEVPSEVTNPPEDAKVY